MTLVLRLLMGRLLALIGVGSLTLTFIPLIILLLLLLRLALLPRWLGSFDLTTSLALDLALTLNLTLSAEFVHLELLALLPLTVDRVQSDLVHELRPGEEEVEDDGRDDRGDEPVLVVVELVVLPGEFDQPVEAHAAPYHCENEDASSFTVWEQS